MKRETFDAYRQAREKLLDQSARFSAGANSDTVAAYRGAAQALAEEAFLELSRDGNLIVVKGKANG